VALVTGAARGLGRAEALVFAARGARVVAVDLLDTAETVGAIEQEGGDAVGITADLSGPETAARVLEAALDAYGDVDILVNNAGLVRDRISFNLSSEDWERVLAVNLSASFYLASAAARHWRARGGADAERGRVIINTSSESGLYGNVGQANYAAAKAGVAALTLTLAAELHRSGIRVNAIAPRARTPMSAQAFGDLPQRAAYDPFAPEHVAAVVAWLASDAARDVTGQVLVVHGSGIEVMRTWSPLRRLQREGEWTDAELLALGAELFPDGRTRYIAAPIGDLFVSAPEGKEMIG
jgi:NAD(P)-dependent dehydrogenase (short-subunit alcohol dehydrogenase family)